MNIANDLGERGRVRLFSYSVEGGDGTWVSSPPEKVLRTSLPFKDPVGITTKSTTGRSTLSSQSSVFSLQAGG
jgi:hypothetical protein